jgi:hypothetical protein
MSSNFFFPSIFSLLAIVFFAFAASASLEELPGSETVQVTHYISGSGSGTAPQVDQDDDLYKHRMANPGDDFIETLYTFLEGAGVNRQFDTQYWGEKAQVQSIIIHQSNKVNTGHNTMITEVAAYIDEHTEMVHESDIKAEYREIKNAVNMFSHDLEHRNNLFSVMIKAGNACIAFRNDLREMLRVQFEDREKRMNNFNNLGQRAKSVLISLNVLVTKYNLPFEEAMDVALKYHEPVYHAMDDFKVLYDEIDTDLKRTHKKYTNTEDSVVYQALTMYGAYVLRIEKLENYDVSLPSQVFSVDNTKKTHHYCFPPTVLLHEALHMLSIYYDFSFNNPSLPTKKFIAEFNVQQGAAGLKNFNLQTIMYVLYM